MRLIDTHCHLNFPDAFTDPGAEIGAAREAGVDRLIVIGIDEESSLAAIRLAEAYDGVFATVGWHPNHIGDYDSAALNRLRTMAEHPKVVAIGETGLDYHWNLTDPLKQRAAFEGHLKLAKDLDLPVVIHGRDAYSELLDILETQPDGHYLLHCFGGTAEDAQRASEIGCYFGVDGPVTYKNAGTLREILPALDPRRILIETDSPFLPPTPYRGRPNRPAYLPYINKALAEALSMTPESSAELTTQNAERFFRLPVSS